MAKGGGSKAPTGSDGGGRTKPIKKKKEKKLVKQDSELEEGELRDAVQEVVADESKLQDQVVEDVQTDQAEAQEIELEEQLVREKEMLAEEIKAKELKDLEESNKVKDAVRGKTAEDVVEVIPSADVAVEAPLPRGMLRGGDPNRVIKTDKMIAEQNEARMNKFFNNDRTEKQFMNQREQSLSKIRKQRREETINRKRGLVESGALAAPVSESEALVVGPTNPIMESALSKQSAYAQLEGEKRGKKYTKDVLAGKKQSISSRVIPSEEIPASDEVRQLLENEDARDLTKLADRAVQVQHYSRMLQQGSPSLLLEQSDFARGVKNHLGSGNVGAHEYFDGELQEISSLKEQINQKARQAVIQGKKKAPAVVNEEEEFAKSLQRQQAVKHVFDFYGRDSQIDDFISRQHHQLGDINGASSAFDDTKDSLIKQSMGGGSSSAAVPSKMRGGKKGRASQEEEKVGPVSMTQQQQHQFIDPDSRSFLENNPAQFQQQLITESIQRVGQEQIKKSSALERAKKVLTNDPKAQEQFFNKMIMEGNVNELMAGSAYMMSSSNGQNNNMVDEQAITMADLASRVGAFLSYDPIIGKLKYEIEKRKEQGEQVPKELSQELLQRAESYGQGIIQHVQAGVETVRDIGSRLAHMQQAQAQRESEISTVLNEKDNLLQRSKEESEAHLSALQIAQEKINKYTKSFSELPETDAIAEIRRTIARASGGIGADGGINLQNIDTNKGIGFLKSVQQEILPQIEKKKQNLALMIDEISNMEGEQMRDALKKVAKEKLMLENMTVLLKNVQDSDNLAQKKIEIVGEDVKKEYEELKKFKKEAEEGKLDPQGVQKQHRTLKELQNKLQEVREKAIKETEQHLQPTKATLDEIRNIRGTIKEKLVRYGFNEKLTPTILSEVESAGKFLKADGGAKGVPNYVDIEKLLPKIADNVATLVLKRDKDFATKMISESGMDFMESVAPQVQQALMGKLSEKVQSAITERLNTSVMGVDFTDMPLKEKLIYFMSHSKGFAEGQIPSSAAPSSMQGTDSVTKSKNKQTVNEFAESYAKKVKDAEERRLGVHQKEEDAIGKAAKKELKESMGLSNKAWYAGRFEDSAAAQRISQTIVSGGKSIYQSNDPNAHVAQPGKYGSARFGAPISGVHHSTSLFPAQEVNDLKKEQNIAHEKAKLYKEVEAVLRDDINEPEVVVQEHLINAVAAVAARFDSIKKSGKNETISESDIAHLQGASELISLLPSSTQNKVITDETAALMREIALHNEKVSDELDKIILEEAEDVAQNGKEAEEIITTAFKTLLSSQGYTAEFLEKPRFIGDTSPAFVPKGTQILSGQGQFVKGPKLASAEDIAAAGGPKFAGTQSKGVTKFLTNDYLERLKIVGKGRAMIERDPKTGIISNPYKVVHKMQLLYMDAMTQKMVEAQRRASDIKERYNKHKLLSKSGAAQLAFAKDKARMNDFFKLKMQNPRELLKDAPAKKKLAGEAV